MVANSVMQSPEMTFVTALINLIGTAAARTDFDPKITSEALLGSRKRHKVEVDSIIDSKTCQQNPETY
jgi:hypothetical protein